MALYKDINIAVSDKYFTQPLPQVAIPLKKPVNAGPTYSDKNYSNGPFIQNFNIPYLESSQISSLNEGGGLPQECPKKTQLYRYGYELHNLNNGKVTGGFDRYNINNVPSCSSRNGNYMVFSTLKNPFSTILASEESRDNWIRDSHSN